MPLAIFFTPKSMNADQYNETIKQLDAQGAGKPDGRLHHVAFGTGNNLRVMDIWESKEKFNAFGQILMPIIQKLGMELAKPPEIIQVYNIVQ